MRGLPGYRWQNKSFCAWLYRIARNEIIRDRYKKRLLSPLGLATGSGATSQRDVELRLQKHEQFEEISQTT